MKQINVEVNHTKNEIRVNDINISLEVLETVTRPDEEHLYQFRRREDNVIVVVPVHRQFANAFNKWMARYADTPEQFSREWEVVHEYLKQEAAGLEPDYGRIAAAYFVKLMTEA